MAKSGFTIKPSERIPHITKAPGDNLDYTLDWGDTTKGPWLPDGDSIASATWTVDAGITKGAEGITASTAFVWLSGGTVGTSYLVTCAITTAQGRVDSRSFYLDVETL